jgi:hypothetical protein
MNWDAATIIRIIVAALLVALLVTILPSCKTVDCLPEVVYRDSIRTEYLHDSIYRYERDSIFIHQKADTVWLEKYTIRYKDVMKIERDTIYQENKVVEVKEVLVEKPIAGVVKWFAWIGAFFVVFYLVKIGLWVYRKFIPKV